MKVRDGPFFVGSIIYQYHHLQGHIRMWILLSLVSNPALFCECFRGFPVEEPYSLKECVRTSCVILHENSAIKEI